MRRLEFAGEHRALEAVHDILVRALLVLLGHEHCGMAEAHEAVVEGGNAVGYGHGQLAECLIRK